MKKIEMLEAMFRGLIANGFKPSKILIALSNVCVNGENLQDVGWDVTDENLAELFAGFEVSIEALFEMES